MEAAAHGGQRAQPVAFAQNNRIDWNLKVCGIDKQPRHMSHLAGFFGFWTHHEARRIAEYEQRNIEGIAKLHESCALIRCLTVNRAPQVPGVVGNQTHGTAFDPKESNDHPDTKVPPKLQK